MTERRALFYTTKNSSFINNLNNFKDVEGRTNTSVGPPAARVLETPDLARAIL